MTSLRPPASRIPRHFICHRGKVAAVDAHAADIDAVSFQFRCQLHDLSGACLGVVGVDEENHAFRPRPRKVFEGRDLVSVHLHEGMRHGPDNGDPITLAGEDVGRAGKTRDVAGARGKQPGLGTMCRAQTEIGQYFPWRCEDHASGFRGDHGLEMHDVD